MRLNKYNSKTCKCILKHIHDSVFESEVCNYLYKLASDKRIKGYLSQKVIDLYVRKKHICSHRVDFMVIKNNGKKFYCEAKGFENPVWNIKRKLTQAIFPKIPYVTVYRGKLNLIDKEIL